MEVLVDEEGGRQEIIQLHLVAELNDQRLDGGLLLELQSLHGVVEDQDLIFLQLLGRVHPRQVDVGPIAQHQHVFQPLRSRNELCPDRGPAAVGDHLVVFQEHVDGHILIKVCLLEVSGGMCVLR